MNVYLDTSALVRLLVDEGESDALVAFLAGTTPITSRIGAVELRRVALQSGVGDEHVAALLRGIAVVVVSEASLVTAERIGAPALRTLDALHLGAALSIASAVAAFVTYDDRQAAAAAACGLTVVSPGLT